MRIIKAIGYGVIVLVLLDLVVVFGGLAQIALEGQTGEWAPFWRAQAEFVVRLLN